MSEGSNTVKVKGKVVDDAVTLFVDDKIFSGWKDVSITRKINWLASNFNFNVNDTWKPNQESIPLNPGQDCHIHVGKTTVLDGYIDSVSLSISANDRNISLAGRSNASDLVDCSYDGQAEYKNISMEVLTKKLLDPFGVKFKFTKAGGKFDKIVIRQGETVGEVLDRMARQKKLIIYSDFEGGIIFTTKGSSRSTTEIQQGVNLLSGNVTHDNSDRFSIYKVKAQNTGVKGLVENSTQNTGKAEDKGIERYRPLVLLAENAANSEASKARAQYEADIRAAKASSFNVTVQGWFQNDGTLWDINKIVGLKSDFLGYRGDLLINSVTYSKSSSGTTCSMELIKPNAFTFPTEIPKQDDLSKLLGL